MSEEKAHRPPLRLVSPVEFLDRPPAGDAIDIAMSMMDVAEKARNQGWEVSLAVDTSGEVEHFNFACSRPKAKEQADG